MVSCLSILLLLLRQVTIFTHHNYFGDITSFIRVCVLNLKSQHGKVYCIPTSTQQNRCGHGLQHLKPRYQIPVQSNHHLKHFVNRQSPQSFKSVAYCNCWLTLKSDKDAIKSSNSLVADEANGTPDCCVWMICLSTFAKWTNKMLDQNSLLLNAFSLPCGLGVLTGVRRSVFVSLTVIVTCLPPAGPFTLGEAFLKSMGKDVSMIHHSYTVIVDVPIWNRINWSRIVCITQLIQ